MSEKMTVDLDREIREMFKRNISLCRYAENHSHALARRGLYPHHRHCPEFCFGDGPQGLPILRTMLASEQSFENPLFHLLFKAFAYGEFRFVRTFVTQNSHEERLTGHLISELASALSIVEAAFHAKAVALYGEPSCLEFHYADMSSDVMESETGADFALILHVNLPDRPESTRVAVCQAKKLYKDRPSIAIDTAQLKDLVAWAGDAAYYCFYDMDPSRLWAPVVTPYREIKNRTEREDADRFKYENMLKDDDFVPVSIFLVFDMLVTQKAGKRFDNLQSATRFVSEGGDVRQKQRQPPSRVLAVSVGGVRRRESEGPRDLHGYFPSSE